MLFYWGKLFINQNICSQKQNGRSQKMKERDWLEKIVTIIMGIILVLAFIWLIKMLLNG
jgi:hypothetical protein